MNDKQNDKDKERSPDDASNDHVNRIEPDCVSLMCRTLAHAQKRPEHRADHLHETGRL